MLFGSSSFVKYLVSHDSGQLKGNPQATKALEDFELGYAAEGCEFAIVDPGGENETYIVQVTGKSQGDVGHSDASLAAVAWTIQTNLEYCDKSWFRDVSGVNSPLVRWFEFSEIGHISEKEANEPWSPHRFHTDQEHDMRPFTEYQLESAPYFGIWNRIYIRIYYDGELDTSFGSNRKHYIDLFEDSIGYERVNMGKIDPSNYLERLSQQFDENSLAATLEKWWELPGLFSRTTN